MSLHTSVSANINLFLLLVDGVHVFWVDHCAFFFLQFVGNIFVFAH